MADGVPPAPPRSSLAAQVRTAVIWRSGSQIGTQIVSWASTLIVIRLLAPQDYGLFAMAQVMLVLLNTMNGYGLASALIREEEVSDERLRQTLGMLMLLNGGLALIQFLAAPLVAAWFEQPMVANLLRVQSLLYFTIPFTALSHAILSRRMDFRRPAQVRLVAAIAGAGTALAGALSGWGVWTLVAAPLAMLTTEAIGMVRVARAPLIPVFRFAGAGHIAGFGGVMTATQLFWFVQSQADVMIAGRVLDPHELGVYTTGLFLAQLLAGKFVPPINEVAYAAYARQHAEGAASDLGAGALLATIRLVMLIALPAYAGLAVVAPVLVPVLLGRQWLEIVPLLPIMSAAMVMMTLQILFAPATNARGVPMAALRITMIGSAVMTAAYFIGSHFGLMGFAWGWVGGMAVLTAVTIRLSGGLLGLRLGALARAVWPPAVAALIMAGGAALLLHILPPLPDLAALAITVTAGIAFYGAALLVIAPDRLSEALSFLRNRGESEPAPPPAPAPAE
ncbi:lipopolysaccharide biosynthesis protein [Erythrobacter neustonensis]|uniref:Lipopolysaccharide biosynthesis protein n=1 Tax=Erythrobacter neustonensis TaxID=1112 RepID=A0A192D3B8_9SPHN|nr:lipopolysaccharide biosynthesis protein [Erythrobacter neustonensis]ANK12600.1 lipopolysaccharide biosynthesis protein [Erythrobacter neustonensis]